MMDHAATHPAEAHEHHLCDADAAALEALLAAGMDAARVDEPLRARAERCLCVLELIGAPTPAPDDLLVDATLARVERARRDAEADLELTPADEDALEALVGAGFDPARCPAGVRPRAHAHAQMLSLLDVRVDEDGREALVAATLARVQAGIDASERRLALPAARPRPGFRWSDLVSVAALLLIGTAVLTPMVAAVRGHAQRSACEAGLLSAMRGFAGYAADYREALPQATASVAGRPWWNVGKPEESNSANLYTVVRARYAEPRSMVCPGNETAAVPVSQTAEDWQASEQISYSYQNLFAHDRPRWVQPERSVVLADRSPVVPRALRGEWVNPLGNSDNHQGHGQNVLWSDGSVAYLRTPVLASGDNIWLPRQLEQALAEVARLQAQGQRPDHTPFHLEGRLTPAGATDVFLSP